MIRPISVPPSQLYGDNPTSVIYPGHPDYWIIETFGNYQPDGHTGEDYPCPVGTPVQAVTSGTVLHVGNLTGAYSDNPWWISPGFAGYCAVIDHGAFIGIYGHCQTGSARVKIGQRVAEGEVFILSGNTGASTGAHLHFEILPDGYVLGGYMYGRTNPSGLFGSGSLAPQSSITPIPTVQEDDMRDDQMLELKLFIQNEIERREVVTREEAKRNLAAAVFELKLFVQDDDEKRHVATRNVIAEEIKEAGK